jgi:hypothetical protein
VYLYVLTIDKGVELMQSFQQLPHEYKNFSLLYEWNAWSILLHKMHPRDEKRTFDSMP